MSGGLLSPSLASDHGHTSLLSRQKLAAFIYAILPTAFRDAPKKTRPLARTAYLDGVRGLAALGVVVLHMVLGFFPNSSYAYNGTPGRDSIFQMPFVRLLYTGQPTIFFLISGYVLSISTIKKCRNQAWGPLQLDLSSKIFRRMFRLYIPSIIATFIPMFMVSFGLFPDVAKFNDEMPHHTFNMAAREPTFFRQFWLWCKTIPPLFWPFDWENFSQNSPYAYQLWTIPVEYRCSMILFLLHIGLSRCRSKTRLVITASSLFTSCPDKWMFPVVAGAFIAEGERPRPAPEVRNGETKLPNAPRKSPNQWLLVGGVILGLWILSVPAADIWNAWTFAILETWAPKNYKGIFRFWDAVGTVILVWSMTGLPSFQRFFTRRIFLYLGNISFSLYLTHTIALKFLLYPIMPWLYLIFGYSTPFQYGLSFAIGGFLTVMLSFWIADVFQRHIEEPSARFTKWIDTKCSAS
ncbi:hypothetical protein CIHG_04300 [Coccidioides immitis H538.4]|uniref:Acyltransferase 3 domain-containing protein n=1 Tax=Coccidioides immitis H538.4 TaxID=396776 RepID=A0A0J8RPH6_COCIT|nr:hypothetical protein CIHG_04300 [Coccidioides immitis H538.4]